PHSGTIQMKLPLLWPEQATVAQTKVRCWCGAGMEPAAPGGLAGNASWHDTGPEEVPGKNRLPALVLQTEQLVPALTLQLGANDVSAPVGVIVDRALMQVHFQEDGKRHFRARFLISRLNADMLEFELPMPLAQLKSSLTIQIDGKFLTPLDLGEVTKV